MGESLHVTPLTSTIAARVEGIDLAQPVSPEAGAQLRQALWEHSVIVLPGQDITLEQNLRFAEVFGTPEPSAVEAHFGNTDPVNIVQPGFVRGRGQPKRGADVATRFLTDHPSWHADQTASPSMPAYAMLRAEVVPPVGGDTCWASMYAAYDTLSDLMKSWLESATAVHVGNYGKFFEQFGEEANSAFHDQRIGGPRDQPIVVVHPVSGRKALFVNPVHTTYINGLSRGESRTLLNYLFAHSTRADTAVYRHHWSVGDVVVWDELAALHLAADDYYPHDRRLVRVYVGHVTPTAAGGGVHSPNVG